MKAKLIIVFLLCMAGVIQAQVESSTSLRIDAKSDLKTDKYSLSTGLPKSDFNSNIPLYTAPKELSEYGRRKQTFDMTGNDGFFKPEIKGTPKWFKKDKEIKEEYKSDQYLGDFKSDGKFVRLLYRDHQFVDGDIVRIFINDDVIVQSAYLSGKFQGISIDLIKGFNKIDIQALNQGESGPNTAEFHLYDDQGNLLTSNEWNLTKGVKASLIVVKE
ncbi:hypothetical protein [Aquimarina algiphila]|uniref:Secreted protein n=1 Tax=Aquimarina algiphila TaxID=2047982 RepID=A0A554VRW7_9FLAO|nr:hypothetical protein [Aquimarina algiphila]TSE11435.1 hypothetical protein FOF46_00185 [Aquimarina algiphila]